MTDNAIRVLFGEKPIYNQKGLGRFYLITANFKVQLLGYAIRVY